jgi:hypothetical protein
MMKDVWPSWHPGRILRAEELRGLEDYLLWRSRFIEDVHGVDDFNIENLSLLTQDGVEKVSVKGALKGITPKGQPVVLTVQEKLEANIPAASAQTLMLDIYVRVNDADDATSKSEFPPPKLTLRIDEISDNRFELAPDPDPDRLFLGRYSWIGPKISRVPQLIKRPPVTRLAAIEPLDRNWQQWTKPLRQGLQAVIRDVKGRDRQTLLLVQMAAACEVTELAFSWPYLPLPQLAFRLLQLRWLRSRDNDEIPEEVTPFRPPVFSTTFCDNLPEELANLIQSGGGVSPLTNRLRPGSDVNVITVGNQLIFEFKLNLDPDSLELHVEQSTPPNSIRVETSGTAPFLSYIPVKASGSKAVYALSGVPKISPGNAITFSPINIIDPKLVDLYYTRRE